MSDKLLAYYKFKKNIRFQNAYVNVTENYETLDEMPRAEMKDALRSFFTQCNIIIQLVL